jgi:cold shock CspA family protein
MSFEPRITFRGIERSPGIEVDVRKRLDKLRTYCSSILAASVLIEPRQRHHRGGNRFHIRIDLSVPGETILIAHEASLRPTVRATRTSKVRKQDELDRSRRYLGVAIREAFAQARRRLQDYARHRRRAVKLHTPAPEGRIVRLFPLRSYGFLEAEDGHEVYFQQSSVLDDAFGDLRVGSRVVFAEERGRKGPQASTVRLVG